MRQIAYTLFSLCFFICQAFEPDMALWYESPATCWQETVPLGNGRLGMMPDGGIDNEKIVLNEITMWSGSVSDYSNPQAAKSLPDIQKLLIKGHNKEAQDLMYREFVPSKGGSGATYGYYQMLADLDIEYHYQVASRPSNYVRWLDLSQAIAGTSFTLGPVSYMREYFVPRGSNIMVAHISADRDASVSFSATIARAERATTSMRDNCLWLTGTLDSGSDTDGVKYAACVKVYTNGGNSKCADGKITVTSANEAWIVISARTNYYDTNLNVQKAALNDLPKAASDIFEIRRRGIHRHYKMFTRVGITLPASPASSLPTDKRIESFATADDPQLAALYYNYGRYLLISSTDPNGLPPNLQGLWANECSTPWNGDYHTNINVQMNHWPVEPSNLPELHLPLINLTSKAVESGQRTAKAFYGPKAKGWVMHMMTNPWQYTEPGEHPSWGATNTGGAWLCAHLWEHYLYNPTDTAYLKRVYPVMKGASEFFLSTMITEPGHGWLVTAPSSSPENEFYDPLTNAKVSVCMGPAMDTQIVGELFTNVAEAATILGVDTDYANELRRAIAKLPPPQIATDGRLMEWLEEYRETDPNHRHVSHLYALHPGNQISPVTTPELAEACRNTLNTRGDGGTGWSRAWKINFWARLADGDRAYKLFRSLLTPAIQPGKEKHGSGTFPNLFCAHPPFQIDGNFGGAAGIGEMLLQSHTGYVHLLPALPSTWTEGELHGIKVRGGATVDMQWAESRPTTATIANAQVPTKVLIPAGADVRINGVPAPQANNYVTIQPGTTTRLDFSYK